MRWLIRLFVLSLLLIPIGVIAVAALCVETTALVKREALLSSANVKRAKNLLREHNPQKLRTGEVKTVSMSEEEVGLLVHHLINRLGSGNATLEMHGDRLAFAATVDLSKILPGRYLNVQTNVSAFEGVVRVEKLKIGRVSFPRTAVQALVSFGAEHVYRASGVTNVKEVIRAVAIHPQRLDITYEWKEEIVVAVRDRIVSRDDRELLRIYNEVLAAEIDRLGSSLSFASLVQGIFGRAKERSVVDDPVAENRAAVMVLAAYVNGSKLTALAPEAVDWVKPRRVRLKIYGRRDFVQHFTTSAALAVAGGGAVSNAIGLYKEIDDADGGSGFSFKDLAADKAGTEFGQVAVGSESSARTLQSRIEQGISDKTLIPNVSDLEENMTDSEFKRRYGGVEAKKYALTVEVIERRIAASALYK